MICHSLIIGASCLALAMTSADAISVLLNSKSSVNVKTFEEAKKQVEQDAIAGKPLSQFTLSVLTADKKQAEKYAKASRAVITDLAENENDPLALYLLSMEKNDVKLLQRAADGGNVQALNALGSIATQEVFRRKDLSSNEVARVLSTSYGYFSQAAAKNDPNGFINLGTCYLKGLGCQQDMTLAFKCFQIAASAGHPEGMDNLSACYQFGHGVGKDSAQCLYWAMRGRAARGNEAAEKWLQAQENLKKGKGSPK